MQKPRGARDLNQFFDRIRPNGIGRDFRHFVLIVGDRSWGRMLKLLSGHKSDHVTTHYSAPEIGSLIEASEKVCAAQARKVAHCGRMRAVSKKTV